MGEDPVNALCSSGVPTVIYQSTSVTDMKITFAAILIMTFGAASLAQAPEIISYQGFLEDGDEAVNDPGATLTFRIHSVPTGGDILWTETHTNVSVEDGVFAVVLGSAVSLGVVDF